MWTQVISRSTAIASSLNAHQLAHQQTMDDLNNIADRSLDGKRGAKKLQMQIESSDKDLDRLNKWIFGDWKNLSLNVIHCNSMCGLLSCPERTEANPEQSLFAAG